jgi:hypothetical protein
MHGGTKTGLVNKSLSTAQRLQGKQPSLPARSQQFKGYKIGNIFSHLFVKMDIKQWRYEKANDSLINLCLSGRHDIVQKERVRNLLL